MQRTSRTAAHLCQFPYEDDVVWLHGSIRGDTQINTSSTGQVKFALDGATVAATAGVGTATAGPTYPLKEIYDDPTYRIQKLEAANNVPKSVNPQIPLCEAITLMMSRDFSQLPVMTNERDVKGINSWAMIGRKLALGKTSRTVSDFSDNLHHEISDESSIFQAIPVIVEHQYVLIRGKDKRITGIVTATDLSQQFLKLFLLLGEIENHLRNMIRAKFLVHKLQDARDPADDRQINDVSDFHSESTNDFWKRRGTGKSSGL